MASTYEIRVKGRLSQDWSDWFQGLTIADYSIGDTLISGRLQDQAELYGVLIKIRDLGLELISVQRIESNDG